MQVSQQMHAWLCLWQEVDYMCFPLKKSLEGSINYS